MQICDNLPFTISLIEKLPIEILFYIFSYLEFEDIYSCLHTCKILRNILTSDYFWLNRFNITNINLSILPIIYNVYFFTKWECILPVNIISLSNNNTKATDLYGIGNSNKWSTIKTKSWDLKSQYFYCEVKFYKNLKEYNSINIGFGISDDFDINLSNCPIGYNFINYKRNDGKISYCIYGDGSSMYTENYLDDIETYGNITKFKINHRDHISLLFDKKKTECSFFINNKLILNRKVQLLNYKVGLSLIHGCSAKILSIDKSIRNLFLILEHIN